MVFRKISFGQIWYKFALKLAKYKYRCLQDSVKR